MNIDQILLLASTTGTWVTVGIIFFTLREMAKQRKASYQPVIVPKQQNVNGVKNPLVSVDFPTLWSEKHPDEIGKEEINFTYCLRLFNLGNGAAKNIRVKWDFDISKSITEINELCKQTSQDIKVVVDKSHFMMISGNQAPLSATSINLDKEGNYDHLLPANIENTGLNVPLPAAFIDLVSLRIHLIYQGKQIIDYQPKIILSLKYQDIAGINYSAKFLLKLKIVSVGGPSEKGNVLIFGGLLTHQKP